MQTRKDEMDKIRPASPKKSIRPNNKRARIKNSGSGNIPKGQTEIPCPVWLSCDRKLRVVLSASYLHLQQVRTCATQQYFIEQHSRSMIEPFVSAVGCLFIKLTWSKWVICGFEIGTEWTYNAALISNFLKLLSGGKADLKSGKTLNANALIQTSWLRHVS